MRRKREYYDIFISYRRSNGWDTAKHLRDILVEKGYSVFFDVDSLRNGDFNMALLEQIENCKDFIIILSENSLDRCQNEGDWVRTELAYALKAGKNVIPIKSSKFHFPDNLPEDIEAVRKKNAVITSYDYFESMVQKLISFLISKPKKKPWVKLGIGILAVAVIALLGVVFLSRNTGKDGVILPPISDSAVTAIATSSPVAESTAEISVPTVTPAVTPTPLPTVKPEDIDASGQKAVNYLSKRVEESCPITVYDPEGSAAEELGTIYNNAAAALALLADNEKNKNHSDSDLKKIIDILAEQVNDGSILTPEMDTGSLAAASVALMKYDSAKTSFACVRAAQKILDWIIENRKSESGFYTNNSLGNRATAENLWLIAAFNMVSEKTGNAGYAEAAQSAEVFVQSMRSSDGTFYLAGDAKNDNGNSGLISTEVQALAAMVMKDRTGLAKAAAMCGKNGGFMPDSLSDGDISTESTLLMVVAFQSMGMKQEAAQAIAAAYQYQRENGSLPEAGIAPYTDGQGKNHLNQAKTSATAWYAIAAEEYNPFMK